MKYISITVLTILLASCTTTNSTPNKTTEEPQSSININVDRNTVELTGTEDNLNIKSNTGLVEENSVEIIENITITEGNEIQKETELDTVSGAS